MHLDNSSSPPYKNALKERSCVKTLEVLGTLNPELPEKALLSRWFSYSPFGGICDRSLEGKHPVAKLKVLEKSRGQKKSSFKSNLKGPVSSLSQPSTPKKTGEILSFFFLRCALILLKSGRDSKKQKNTKWSTPLNFSSFFHPKHVAKVHIHAPGKPGETVVSKCGYLPTYLLP